MATKQYSFALWFPLGIGAVFAGAALMWPEFGALLFAIGGGIASAAVVHRYYGAAISITIGIIVGLTIFGAPWVISVLRTDGEGATAALNYKIGLDCILSARPSHSREDKSLYMIEIVGAPTQERPIQYMTATTSFMPGIQELKWGNDFPQQMMLCTFTNYSGLPVLRVSAKLAFVWRSIISATNGYSSGPIVANGEVDTPSLDLGAGSDSRESFLIANLSSDTFASFSLPATAIAYSTGSGERHVVKLIPTGAPPMALFPFQRPASPPTASLPFPTPPASQTGMSQKP